MQRKEGYYWVKRFGVWMIGEYANGYWLLMEVEAVQAIFLKDSEFEEINETQILPPQ